MTYIKDLADKISDELCDAKGYAESYVESKVKGNGQQAQRFKEMASDELKHAGYIHEMAVQEIETLQKSITPPENMRERWQKAHVKYVDDSAWIKQMLAM